MIAAAGAEVEWSGGAEDVGGHYPVPSPLPRLMASDRPDARLIESDGTGFGVFSSAREGWKSLSFDLPAGILAGCMGLRFSVRSDEPYDGLVVRISDGSGSVFSTTFDLSGDGSWREIELPFFGDGFRTGAFQPLGQLDAASARRVSFVLPYHRPLSFALGRIDALRAPVGDVPCPAVYPMVEVCDYGGDVSWNVLGSDFGKRVRAYAQVSSGEPRVSDERLRALDCQVWLTAGGDEERAVAAMPGVESAMRPLGLPFESKVFAGYSHHGMKYQASLAEALAFLRRHV